MTLFGLMEKRLLPLDWYLLFHLPTKERHLAEEDVLADVPPRQTSVFNLTI